jgi:hypothetical protein
MTLQRSLIVALLVLFTLGATPQSDARVQSFVCAQLLRTWCDSTRALDNEACLCYLRGAFDALQIARHATYRELIEGDDGADSICISNLVPVTQLKIAMRRYAKKT